VGVNGGCDKTAFRLVFATTRLSYEPWSAVHNVCNFDRAASTAADSPDGFAPAGTVIFTTQQFKLQVPVPSPWPSLQDCRHMEQEK
jgi:hypothetical protein